MSLFGKTGLQRSLHMCVWRSPEVLKSGSGGPMTLYIPFYTFLGVSLPLLSSGALLTTEVKRSPALVYLVQNAQILPKVAKCWQVNQEAHLEALDTHLPKYSGHSWGQTLYLRCLPLPSLVTGFTHFDQAHQLSGCYFHVQVLLCQLDQCLSVYSTEMDSQHWDSCTQRLKSPCSAVTYVL